jgi:hypothetical protein
MSNPRRNFVNFHSQGFCVFKKFAAEKDMRGLREAVTSRSFDPEWVEIHNWGDAKARDPSIPKRWMAAAPKCAQSFFTDKIVPFLESGGFYSTRHNISLGRGVAVLK